MSGYTVTAPAPAVDEGVSLSEQTPAGAATRTFPTCRCSHWKAEHYRGRGVCRFVECACAHYQQVIDLDGARTTRTP